jgi:hypothetical protein
MNVANKVNLQITVVGLAFLLSGCVSNLFPGGPTPAGGLITNVRSPALNLAVAMDSSAGSTKIGTSTVGAFIGLFAFGDGSIDAAIKNGGITKVHHIDHEVSSFLFSLWIQDKTIVYGE